MDSIKGNKNIYRCKKLKSFENWPKQEDFNSYQLGKEKYFRPYKWDKISIYRKHISCHN